MKNIYIAIILLFGFVAGSAYLINREQEPVTSSDNADKSFTQVIQEMAHKGKNEGGGEDVNKPAVSNGWTSYTDPESGFSFKIPPGWQLETRVEPQGWGHLDHKTYSLTKYLTPDHDLRIKITTGIEGFNTIYPITNDNAANEIVLRKTMQLFGEEFYLIYAGYAGMGVAWHAYLTDFFEGECNYCAIMPLPGARGQFNVEVNAKAKNPEGPDDWAPLLGKTASDDDYIEAEAIISSLSYK